MTEDNVDTGILSSEEQRYPDSHVENPVFQWKEDTTIGDSLKVLDPKDPLMRRFQDTLKAHLMRIERKLTDDILDLENSTKDAEKQCETKAIELYSVQKKVERQEKTLNEYETKMFELKEIRDKKDSRLAEARELQKSAKEELGREKRITEKFTLEIESHGSLSRKFDEFEKQIASHTKISRRMSEKDATMKRDLLRKKQQEDYLLAKLVEEVWRLEQAIEDCCKELAIKEKERLNARQTVTDADADLEGLQSYQKKMFKEWNHVVASISQREKVNDQLAKERTKIRESFTTLNSQIDKLKKDTTKEMENNERLTSVETRLEDDVRYTLGKIEKEKEKLANLEYKLIEVSDHSERTQAKFDTACYEHQRCLEEEKVVDKEMEKLNSAKAELEDSILSKLENKVTNDKTVRSLNRTLREARDKMKEAELSMLITENSYGKNVYELERLNGLIATERYEVEDSVRSNNKRERELDGVQNELKQCDLVIGKRQQKIVSLNKKIEEVISSLTGGEETSPHDLKITELQKNIDETETSNRKGQEFWLRRVGYMVTLTEQRNAQLKEINLLDKQIMIMEQKNLKLMRDLERQKKEDDDICRRVKVLQQKVVNTNAQLAAQSEMHDDLEDKNCITMTECVATLREAETELLSLQNDIIQLKMDKVGLEEQLRSAQRESLSWEKKVQLASETAKELKEQRCAGGDVALMKSEIHKMEMRLSHLRKAQEKMIRDMEYCIARREVIMDGAMAREKRNPKGLHNQRVVFEKRMNDQKLKIKQITKETKQLENQISDLESQQKTVLEKVDDNRKSLRAYEDSTPEVDKQISEAELMKYHKLECLVRKQRKVRMLQDVKDGRYKMLYKSELSLNDELQKQRATSIDLKEVMEETRRDFPLLQDSIRKIILGMETS